MQPNNNAMDTYQFNYEKELTDKLDKFGCKDFGEQEILEMTLWKLSRVPHVNHDTLHRLNSLATIKNINSKENKENVYDALRSLLDCKGVRLPMASTYLRFRNPSVFQIIDQRVWHQLYDTEYENSYNKDIQIEKYIQYLKDLRARCQRDDVPFEIADRYYYQKDAAENHHIKY